MRQTQGDRESPPIDQEMNGEEKKPRRTSVPQENELLSWQVKGEAFHY
jgi:hypothetical protein